MKYGFFQPIRFSIINIRYRLLSLKVSVITCYHLLVLVIICYYLLSFANTCYQLLLLVTTSYHLLLVVITNLISPRLILGFIVLVW